MKKNGKWWRSLHTRSNLAMLIIAAVMIQVSGAVQFFFARNGIRKEVDVRAQSEMKMKSLEIQQILSGVEIAVDNINSILMRTIEHPENIYPVLEEFVKRNPNIQGCALAFEPNFFPDKGYWYEPYVLRGADGTFNHMQIADSSHDYHNMSWYKEGLVSESGRWTEPYIDNEGAQGVICTYTFPVKNSEGEVVAVFGADLSLNWLTDEFVSDEDTKSYSFIVSREGRIIACPDKSMIMNYTLDDASAEYQDTTINAVNRALLAGDSGKAEVKDNNGELAYMYYSPVEGQSGWSMAILFPDREIYKGLRTVALRLVILMLLGLALMVYIMWRTVNGFKRLEVVSAEKERIGSELRIASEIQMSMVPRLFPAFPHRNDIDLHASISPAKEVGGDLYDYFIQNDVLYFCVGDVSGKGVPASLFMAVTRNLFRIVAQQGLSPVEIATQINKILSKDNDQGMFVTMFIGKVDLNTGHLDYCNCGHNAPIIDGQFLKMQYYNQPLGLWEDDPFDGESIDNIKGKQLLLYTDGLNESENPNKEQLGNERLIELMQNAQDMDAHQVIDMLATNVEKHRAGADPNDDMTLLCLRIIS
jgi:sigma-B regulation protein RsbU (phosphoserine phosphatase)